MKRTDIKNREKEKNRGLPSLTKPTILFIALGVVGVIAMVAIIFYVNKVTSLEFEEPVYQYIDNVEVNHEIGTTIADQNMSTILFENDNEYGVDPTPFYSKNKKQIYIPKSFSWYSVEEDGAWRVPEFTLIQSLGENVYRCELEQAEYNIVGGFLVDEATTYVFLEAGTITLDYKTYQVSPFSFFSQEGGVSRIFDYETNKFYFFEEKIKTDVIYKSVGGYSIDLKKGRYTDRQNITTLLPASPSILTNVEERSK